MEWSRVATIKVLHPLSSHIVAELTLLVEFKHGGSYARVLLEELHDAKASMVHQLVGCEPRIV